MIWNSIPFIVLLIKYEGVLIFKGRGMNTSQEILEGEEDHHDSAEERVGYLIIINCPYQ